MTWNYRLLRHLDGRGQIYLAVHEVYYDEEGKPDACTVEPVRLIGQDEEHGDHVNEILKELAMIRRDLMNGAPVLDYATLAAKSGGELTDTAKGEYKAT